jgi:predicted ATPase
MSSPQFGRFRLCMHRRELLADGTPVPVGARALDVLVVLIEARGRLVTKDELLERVWPGTIVEENALQVQISTLRKALGQDHGFIKTISGRGYCFIAEVTNSEGSEPAAIDPAPASAPRPGSVSPPTNLPAPTSGLIGRESQLSDLTDLVETHRLVTLIGTPGVGKTRLGLELARLLLPKFADGVWIAELGSLSDPELVLPALASLAGVAATPASPACVAAAFASRHLLIILDNCEHVIDAAARIAEAFLHASASVQVIATSREPLRVDGECTYRVPSLDVPAQGTDDIADLMRHSAVKLFVTRARAAGLDLSLDARLGAATGEICRRLDGIPLAIELAAAASAVLGVDGVAARLDARFNLPAVGRRTAPPRHQTLRAALDWSYELLPEPQQAVMRRLAVFAGSFTLQAAVAVVADQGITEDEITDHVLGLVTKSLVVADVRGFDPRYRLLETMRAYALEKLGECGELESVVRCHADYVQKPLERTEPGQGMPPSGEGADADGRGVNNEPQGRGIASGDGATFDVAQTAPSARRRFGLSLMDESHGHVERELVTLRPEVSEEYATQKAASRTTRSRAVTIDREASHRWFGLARCA